MSSGNKWTPSQWDAIRHTDGALLVSAAAGSGKTAVLAERCVYLVCDAAEPCDIDQLLVLTFTRAAASEMRERIEKRLRDRVAQSDDARLQQQLRLIERASFTTIDGFCASLVRANFHQLGIDPAFSILAPEDAALLKSEVVDRLLDVEFDSPDAPTLKLLLDSYFASDDTRLRSELISSAALVHSVIDPEQWTAQALKRINGAADGSDSTLLDRFRDSQQHVLRATRRALENARRFAAEHDGLSKYVSHVDEVLLDLQDWQALSDRNDFNALAARVGEYKAPTLPRVANETPFKVQAQKLVDDAKKQMKKDGSANKACSWSNDQLRAGMQRVAPHAACFLSLISKFTRAYDVAKHELRSLDFADTETLALKVLRADSTSLTPSATARELHTRFRYVLVDEYQDINPIQNAILRLISRDIAAEQDASIRSNYFTVGDVKQSIYRFRLAEPQQFIDRQAQLRASGSIGNVIDLQENFRSRGPLLDAVNDVFRLLMTADSTGIDYDTTHELRSISPYPDLGPQSFAGKPIELHLLPKDYHAATDGEGDEEEDDAADSFDREISIVAMRIRDLIAEKRVVAVKQGDTLVSRPIGYGDIAVLLRSARFKSSVVADELRSQGIPVHADDSTGFFDVTEVQDVLAILRVISNQQQDIPLAAFLRSPIAAITDPEDALAKIRLANPDQPFYLAVTLYASTRQDELAEQLRQRLELLGQWRRRFQEQDIADALAQMLDETSYLTFCQALPDGNQRVANLRELLARAETFGTFERRGLERFLNFLEELEADDQLGRPALAAASQDFVRVMTVHKSKGLEFPVVIVPDMGKKFNQRSLASPILIDRDLGLGMLTVDLPMRVRYPSLASMAIADHMRRQSTAEEIRVLYVALTRAREHLILVGTTNAPFQAAANDWTEHQGPLPTETILNARTPLDWIVPIAAVTDRMGLGTFEVVDWHDRPMPRSAEATRDDSAAKKLQRLFDRATDDTTSEGVQGAIDRLTFTYAHAASSAEPSTRSIGDLAAPRTPRTAQSQSKIEMTWPNTHRPRAKANAADIGTATHRFMELADPNRIGSPADIAAHIQELIARRLLNEADAKLVNVEAIHWFTSTDVFALLTQVDSRLLREQSVAYSHRPEGLDPSDCVLIRGRIDALVETPAGLVLIDYKTDRVDPERADTRAQTYWPQVRGYASAARAVTKRPIIRASLVFLTARKIIDLPAGMLA